jgi:hypothetical protein
LPYTDPAQKKEWERRHRHERVARRREQRRVEATSQAAQSVSSELEDGELSPWHLLAGGSVLALYNPALALGAGGLILAVAAIQKRSWLWWAIGALIVAIAIFLLLSNRSDDTTKTTGKKK